MASPTGTALIPTQGSCLPLTDIVVFFPNLFIDQDTPANMYKSANLDSNSIEEKVLDVLNSNIVLQKQK